MKQEFTVAPDTMAVTLETRFCMINIRDSGHGCTAEDLLRVESALGHGLPLSYREWLLKYDGGRPTPCGFSVDGHPEKYFELMVFFGCNREEETEALFWNIENLPGIRARMLLPVACTDTDDLLVIELKTGKVLFLDWNAPGESWFVADSFAGFFDSLHAG